jgi:hypothetical protein
MVSSVCALLWLLSVWWNAAFCGMAAPVNLLLISQQLVQNCSSPPQTKGLVQGSLQAAALWRLLLRFRCSICLCCAGTICCQAVTHVAAGLQLLQALPSNAPEQHS